MFANSFCKKTKAFLWLVALWLTTSFAQAQPIWQSRLPTDLRVVGSGEMTWFGFSIYQARLWSKQYPFNPSQPYALELTYARNISKSEFVEASMDEMSRISGVSAKSSQMQQWQGWMEKAFIDVKPGDQLIGVHWPGVGCAFYSQSQLLSEIKDPEFAKNFFAIWLDPQSKDRRLREQLLGKRTSM
ncbi:chalcone isomerase family protein [Leeia sp. TBRC 13508]|uniref:Chalcone isomerase family protein n=1 Tax=Leeia speluncae TaxID=2884804 RepID=A0ABS8D6Z4_9NEIS|nr:chalcone isomerase family protein [Leeia speluncae]MCB6183970.1 chalcone isomerase family protein [Leeia speluncae]